MISSPACARRDLRRAAPRSGACVFFFFQAEDGIRDVAVTGVQTCALPILPTSNDASAPISAVNRCIASGEAWTRRDRKSTRLNSSHGHISYAVFCLKKETRIRELLTQHERPEHSHADPPDAVSPVRKAEQK